MIQALDFGAGNFKRVGADGAHVLPSQMATVLGESLGRSAGLKTRKPPVCIGLNGSRFYVGAGAHDWGRPIENLADERFIAGAPELRALVYATLPAAQSIHAIVGLPQSALADGQARDTANAVKGWLMGVHEWTVDGEPRAATVDQVTVASQAAGALFDYLLDDAGVFLPARKAHFKEELGVVSVGMSTLELLVVRNGAPVERFTSSLTAGVRRVLDLVDPQGLYSRGELDEALRANRLDVSKALPVWSSEVVGHIENAWGKAFRRFAAVLTVGGGALLLQPTLLALFNGRSVLLPEPVISVARGLYKLAVMKSR
jgi:hypothetical protein